VDVGRCVTLYNEISREFPAWLSGDVHNALMGCMGCQLCCPANREPLRLAGRLEDVSEQETRRILDGTPDQELLESLSRKLRGFPPAVSEEYFPILTRNLRVLLEKPA
jgi:epoxyqueuosine reductase